MRAKNGTRGNRYDSFIADLASGFSRGVLIRIGGKHRRTPLRVSVTRETINDPLDSLQLRFDTDVCDARLMPHPPLFTRKQTHFDE